MSGGNTLMRKRQSKQSSSPSFSRCRGIVPFNLRKLSFHRLTMVTVTIVSVTVSLVQPDPSNLAPTDQNGVVRRDAMASM